MASANLFAQYLQPVRSMQDRMAEYDAADLRREQLAGVQRQNRLQELAFQRGEEERAGAQRRQGAIASLLQGAGGDEAKAVQALRGAGFYDEAGKLESDMLGRGKTRVEIGGLEGKNAEAERERKQKERETAIRDISNFDTPESAIADVQAKLKAGTLTMQQASNVINTIQSRPDWKLYLIEGILAPKERLDLVAKRETEKRQAANEVLVFDPKTGRYVTNEPLVSAKARVAQAGASVTLGSPVPVTLADGSTVLVQPGNRPGAQPQVVTVGGKPVSPLPTKQGDATEAERNAAGYLLRMEEATKLLDQFEKKGRASYGTQIAGAVPLVGEAARRVTMTPEQAQYRQAQEDWVRAKLRKESGASIASDEMEREIATYFPMPGEGPEVVEQKRQARLVANDSFRASAGRAAAKPKAAQPAGPFSDAEKERRYQEWKKTQTGAQ